MMSFLIIGSLFTLGLWSFACLVIYFGDCKHDWQHNRNLNCLNKIEMRCAKCGDIKNVKSYEWKGIKYSKNNIKM